MRQDRYINQLRKVLGQVGGNPPEEQDDFESIPASPARTLSAGHVVEPRVTISDTKQNWGPLDQTERDGGDSISLDEIFSRLWRRRAGLLAAAIIGGLVMAFLSLMWPPSYRAKTAIRLEQLTAGSTNLHDMEPAAAGTPDDTYLQNELKVLQSDELARRVALRLNLAPAQVVPRSTPGTPLGSLFSRFSKSHRPSSPDDLRIRAVERALTVRSSLKSQVVEIFFDAADPVAAARGANAVVSEYIAMNLQARSQKSRDTTRWLAGQIVDLKNKLEKGNEQLQSFARSSGLLYADNQNLLSEESARQAQEQLARARADRAAKQARYEIAQSGSLDLLPTDADSGLLREYEGKLAAAQVDLERLRNLYTPEHYKVKDAEAGVALLKTTVDEERHRIVGRLHADFESASKLESTLSGTYNTQTSKLSSQSADAFRYNVLKRDLESTQELYNSLVLRTRESAVASAIRATSVSLIDAARPPASPYSPNLPLNVALGFSGGLVLALGIVLVHDRDAYLANQPSDAPLADIRELGIIPSARRSHPFYKTRGGPSLPGGASVELVTWQEQRSILTEAFRTTLTSILFSPGCQRQHGILTVTSVQPREGKTTAISNLGIALTETHGRVLLIDADLRRPRLHEIFAQCNDKGLTTMLTGDQPIATLKLNTLIRETDIPGLFTMLSGPGSASITPLLYSTRLSAFLTRARQEFDFVLIDTPPTALFSDARILGRLSDAVIVVIHAARTGRAELNDACKKFANDGTVVLGTIVNHWNAAGRGSHKEYDSYYRAPEE